MTRYFTLTAIFIILIFTAGCSGNFMPAASEITAFEIIRVLGIDESTDIPGGVEVSLIAERAKPSPGQEGGGITYEILSESADTAFEAVANLRAKSDKKQIFGYVDYIIYGENTTIEDFARFTDFPGRNPEIRFSPKVFIVRNGTAKSLLTETGSEIVYIGDALDNLSSNVNIRSDFGLLKNIELMNMLDSGNTLAVIPAITAEQPENRTMLGATQPEKRLSAAGYAVVSDFALAGYFEADNARGYNLMTGNVKTRAYSIKDAAGEYVGLDVIGGKLSLKPRWLGDKLIGIDCILNVDANIAEQRSITGLNAPGALEELAESLEETIKEELMSAIELSKQFGGDCFKLGQKIKLKNPNKWRGIESEWREIYKTLPVNPVVVVTVKRVYDLRNPSGSAVVAA